MQRGGTGGQPQLFPNGGHLGVPPHPAPQPDDEIHQRQGNQEGEVVRRRGAHVQPRPQADGGGRDHIVNQGTDHQLPAAVGKGEGGDARLRPEQGEQSKGQQHPQPLDLTGEAAVREHKPGEPGRAEQAEAAQHIAQQNVSRNARQRAGQNAAKPLPFDFFHKISPSTMIILTPL